MLTFGVNIIPDGPISQIVELGKEAERLGFSKCSVMDEGLVTRDVFVTLTALALNTKKMILGTGITNPYTRHPAVTAASIASIDELSSGRAFLGIGAGGSLTLDPLLIERIKPITAVREMIQISRELFTGKSVNFDGEMVRLHGAKIDYARPNIPIWFSGRGEKMLSLAGQYANGVSLDFIHKKFLKDSVERIRTSAEMNSNNPRIAYATFIVTNEDVLRRIRPYLSFSLVDSPEQVKRDIGITSEEVNAIRRTMNQEGLFAAGELIREEWIDPFIISGSISKCVSDIKNLVDECGINELILPILDFNLASVMMNDLSKIMPLL